MLTAHASYNSVKCWLPLGFSTGRKVQQLDAYAGVGDTVIIVVLVTITLIGTVWLFLDTFHPEYLATAMVGWKIKFGDVR